jgi:hypothetical protein
MTGSPVSLSGRTVRMARTGITALAARGQPHRAFIWPIDVVVGDEMPGFGDVMPRLEPGIHPERGEVAIIDNDNAGIDGGDPFVWGTLRLAPEVVRHDAFPSSVTHLYSLAVFLFCLFVPGHPREGVKTEATFSWGAAPRESANDLAVRYLRHRAAVRARPLRRCQPAVAR